jgi:hypothetical protein
MKNYATLLLLLLGFTLSFGQDKDLPEYTGDNFSLEGVLTLFKEAKSIEDFEKAINTEKNGVNNLDLNNDGKIDYINVETTKKGDTHLVVLSTYLSKEERQDIATIGIEKTGKEEAILQIEGDSVLYADDTIVEPVEVTDVIKSGKGGGPEGYEVLNNQIIVNVWFWPCVQYMYAPYYSVWMSPFYWDFYPIWWTPWYPISYTVFYTNCVPYHRGYYRTHTRRVVAARTMYTPIRRVSTRVVQTGRVSTGVRTNSTRAETPTRTVTPKRTETPTRTMTPTRTVTPTRTEAPTRTATPTRKTTRKTTTTKKADTKREDKKAR